MRITTDLLVEFDKTYTKGAYYSYSLTNPGGGRTHVFYNLHTRTTREGLAYLYGVFAELLKRGESTELSDKWVWLTRSIHDEDPKRWESYELAGREAVPTKVG